MPNPEGKVFCDMANKDADKGFLRSLFTHFDGDYEGASIAWDGTTRVEHQLKELKEEIRSLRFAISELALRMDLKGLGINPSEVFLPGLNIGSNQRGNKRSGGTQ